MKPLLCISESSAHVAAASPRIYHGNELLRIIPPPQFILFFQRRCTSPDSCMCMFCYEGKGG